MNWNQRFPTVNEANNYFVGRKFKTIRKKGHIPSGTIITCTHISYGTPIYVYAQEYAKIHFTQSEVKELPLNEKELKGLINDLEDKKKEITSEINIIKEQIKFLKETKNEVFDENEFKAYRTLSLVEDDSLTKMQKAKLIAELIGK